jgi:nitronate monooxygenase
MAGAQGSALALAVTNAGGLGSLPAATLSPVQLRAELEILRRDAQGPWNVNFFCHQPPPVDAQRAAAWRAALAPLCAEAGLPAPEGPAVAARAPFDAVVADLVEAFRPPVVSFHFGLPAPDLLARVKSWGSKVLSSATTVEEALWLQQQGADAIIAQGLEAGGHRGMFLNDDLTTQSGTFALLPQIVRAVELPVIAAGGIADAAGVAAARALGAAAVQVGTAYLLCPEASTSALHRAALLSDAASHTALTNVFTGRPARGIVNRAMRVLGADGNSGGCISRQAPAFPLAATHLAPLRTWAEAQGQDDFTPLWAGQSYPLARAMPAAELTRALGPGLVRLSARQARAVTAARGLASWACPSAPVAPVRGSR